MSHGGQPSPLHQGLISAYLARHPDAQVRRFGPAMRRILAEDMPRDFLAYLTIHPDAFRVLEEERHVVAMEAQVTSSIKAPKLSQYLWGEINGPGSWGASPWVWCLNFKRVQP